MLKYSDKETYENTTEKMETKHLCDLWLVMMLCARCQEVTYLLSVFHSPCSFYAFISRFMDQRGSMGANGSTQDTAWVKAFWSIMFVDIILCIYLGNVFIRFSNTYLCWWCFNKFIIWGCGNLMCYHAFIILLCVFEKVLS